MGETRFDSLFEEMESVDSGGEANDGYSSGGEGRGAEGWADGLDDVDWRKGERVKEGEVSSGRSLTRDERQMCLQNMCRE